jgi:hypothetical protein
LVGTYYKTKDIISTYGQQIRNLGALLIGTGKILDDLLSEQIIDLDASALQTTKSIFSHPDHILNWRPQQHNPRRVQSFMTIVQFRNLVAVAEGYELVVREPHDTLASLVVELETDDLFFEALDFRLGKSDWWHQLLLWDRFDEFADLEVFPGQQRVLFFQIDLYAHQALLEISNHIIYVFAENSVQLEILIERTHT